MNKNNFYISFGIWITILPFLGIPGSWKNTLTILSGLFLVLVALGPGIIRRLQTKAKPKRKRTKMESIATVPSETEPEELKFSDITPNALTSDIEPGIPSPVQNKARAARKGSDAVNLK